MVIEDDNALLLAQTAFLAKISFPNYGAKRGSNEPKMGPVGIFRNSLVKKSYLILFMSSILVNVYIKYNMVTIACSKTGYGVIYGMKRCQTCQNGPFRLYLLKTSFQSEKAIK